LRDANTDLRIIRTRESIREALIDLIEEKGFEAITVKDMTTRARINRGTFYAHYQDKYDLMTRCQEEFMNGLSQIVKQNLTNIMADLHSNHSPTAPFTVMVVIFEYINLNRRFMRAVSGPKGDLSFLTKLKNFMWKTLFERKELPLIKQENLLVPSEYLVSYIASAHIGVIQQWLNGDGNESPQEMALILTTLTGKGPLVAAGLNK
jgi:AcrR family transcriptional regulator